MILVSSSMIRVQLLVSSLVVSVELSESAAQPGLLQDRPVHLLCRSRDGSYHAAAGPSALLHPGGLPHCEHVRL